jgi:two-component sensor histidine kinase
MREGCETDRGSPADETSRVAELEATLARERALTREIDHRTKNTLQLISSLLLLASRRSDGEETRRALRAMHQRVSAVAAAHRSMLAADEADRVDLAGLVRELAAALAHAHQAAIRLTLDPVAIESAAAAPVALIVNELVLNALAHGGGGAPPEIAVDLRKEPAGFTLAVEDRGPGPAAVKDTGLGLTMVRLLAQQIGAQFGAEDAQPGLRAVVTRP